ncbi:MAG TPA: hypothetical protein PLD27_10285 [bacterium]|nr:hypothetical protein [bacterium]HOL47632.1 hypothetical protein [bacterium]HPQ19622.1 hypothetical protein [bacterium]
MIKYLSFLISTITKDNEFSTLPIFFRININFIIFISFISSSILVEKQENKTQNKVILFFDTNSIIAQKNTE